MAVGAGQYLRRTSATDTACVARLTGAPIRWRTHHEPPSMMRLPAAAWSRCCSAHGLQRVVGIRPHGVVREPVHLLADGIDRSAEDAWAAVGAPDFPPHVRR